MELARRHLEQLASRPRPAGSAAERDARTYCARVLSELGFATREEPFEYSTVPGRLATPWCGAASIVLLAAAGHLGWRGNAPGALAVLAIGGALLATAALWLGRHGVLNIPWCRQQGTNLVATRGDTTPPVWLVAHLDSKSQPIPIAIRALGVLGTITTWILALLVAGFGTVGRPTAAGSVAWAWPWLAAAVMVAGAPVVASVVGARSPGALDDASGVAAVLLTAAQLPHNHSVGVLLTSAEELGLAGARAWVRQAARGVAINFDGLDDAGAIRFTYTGRIRIPNRIIIPLLAAAREIGVRATSGPLVPGVLVDGVALAAAGWEAVTVSKGTWRTVTRIHTPRDDLSPLTGAGVADVARVVVRALMEIH